MTFLSRQLLGIWYLSIVVLAFSFQVADVPPNLRNVGTVAAYSPDGGLLAIGGVVEGISGVSIYNTNFEREAFYKAKDSISALAWNSDGSRLAIRTQYMDGDTVEIISASPPFEPLTVSSLYVVDPNKLLWSPNDRYVITHSDLSIIISNTSDGTRHQEILADEAEGYWRHTDIAWHPDGSLLILQTNYLESRARVLLYDLEKGSMIRETEIGFRASHIEVNPNGEQFAVAYSDTLQTMEVYAFASGERLRRFQPLDPSLEVTVLQWTPDGGALAILGDHDDGIQFWDAETGELTMTVKEVLPENIVIVQSFALHPDSRSIAIVAVPQYSEATAEPVFLRTEGVSRLIPNVAAVADLSQFSK